MPVNFALEHPEEQDSNRIHSEEAFSYLGHTAVTTAQATLREAWKWNPYQYQHGLTPLGHANPLGLSDIITTSTQIHIRDASHHESFKTKTCFQRYLPCYPLILTSTSSLSCTLIYCRSTIEGLRQQALGRIPAP